MLLPVLVLTGVTACCVAVAVLLGPVDAAPISAPLGLYAGTYEGMTAVTAELLRQADVELRLYRRDSLPKFAAVVFISDAAGEKHFLAAGGGKSAFCALVDLELQMDFKAYHQRRHEKRSGEWPKLEADGLLEP